MKTKKVSIIMGIYNCEKTLERAINSVLEQTYQEWELIMCDDASNDKTYEIAQKYEKKYPDKIHLIKNEQNCRLAASLNRCLAFASGEYIARLDADDYCANNRLEVQVEYLNNNQDIAVVGCGRILFDENGIRNTIYYKEKPEQKDILKMTPFAHPTIVARREVYDVLSGYRSNKNTMRAEDLDLWFRFYEHGYKGINIQQALYYYHESSEDMKKRNFKAAVGTARVILEGIKRMKWSKLYGIFALRPIISYLIPNSIMIFFHEKLDKRVKCKKI